MDNELKKLIHAFRNALVMAADTHSFGCFSMPRWSELNSFPHGCCDLASNFLAQYLTDYGYEPEIIWFECCEELNKYIKSHVVVRINDYYVDLTRNQFDDHNGRVLIEDKFGSIPRLIKQIKSMNSNNVEDRNININTFNSSGYELYSYIKKIANNLIN
ncbi:TPA: hypothetical protein PBQ56_004295 [Escherichia coli]|uniref:hypothetical protein n=1 Tax=Enterobacteriaceae TaxID=543 RepID=UPI0006A60EDD|nr:MULTISPECIES: hypothetical protein [Enterobacteriaceae]AWJ05690.1 hypothetical protein DEP49_15730 [Escherichia coli]EIY9314929.1 hypothetical protein [Escherichia coli]EJA4830504.1 hypothetical protein [Escherichia coli]EKQ5211965.1 hypothetical protein [Escherichia coli]MBF9115616.1 hypothetical protein [Escherichia coli]